MSKGCEILVDQKKIILMAKMAVYEKKQMRRDKRVLDYFVEDYVYINNFKTRFFITLITLGWMIVGAFKIISKEIIYPTSMWQFIDVYVKPYIAGWLIMLVIYTFLSSLIYGNLYRKANERFTKYKKMLKELEKYEESQDASEGVTDEIQ